MLYVIRRILKAPIQMPDGHLENPKKGTPQGGIISPLLANVVLNELDHWVESQWQNHPVIEKYSYRENAAGCPIHSHAYRAMRNTNLKEMYIVRYADDFRILCRTKEQANRTLIAVTKWLTERLKLEVSPEKTRVVDVRRSYSEFLGFKIRLRKKGKKHVVQSHMCDKAYKRVKADLVKQVGNIKFPRACRGESGEVHLFNSMVMGIQNYYRLATDISLDCNNIGRAVDIVLKNRLKAGKSHRLKKEGRDLTKSEIQRYGKSKRLRYLAQSKEPVYPISYIRCKKPMDLKRNVCAYTPQGRSEIHNDLQMDTTLLLQLMKATAFASMRELIRRGKTPDPEHYEVTYYADLPAMWQDVPNNEVLEELFQMFNLSRPQDFEGHSLSVSDVIALKRNGEVSVHYVDSIGFKDLQGFLDKQPERPSVLMNLKEKCDAPECNPTVCRKARDAHEL